MADADGDGLISVDELTTFFGGYIIMDEVEDVEAYVNEYHKYLDVDEDGLVDLAEFKALFNIATEGEDEGEENDEYYEE